MVQSDVTGRRQGAGHMRQVTSRQVTSRRAISTRPRHDAGRIGRIRVFVGLGLVLGITLDSAAAGQMQRKFEAWKQAFRSEAVAFGIAARTYDREMTTARLNLTVPDLVLPQRDARKRRKVRGQAEFTKPPQAYLNPRYLKHLAARGRKLLDTHGKLLRQIEQRIGVPPEIVLAIWGRETAYGGHRLPHDAISALATQAFTGRRPDLFKTELLFALKILDEGHAARQQLRSSWAGAVGLTQFMPSEVFSTAYDFDGDGQKNLWAVPDALASAANQLRQKGWIAGRPWGLEVSIAGSQADCAMAGPQKTKSMALWEQIGVRHVSGRQFSEQERGWPAYLLVPGGTFGPVFLVTDNYVVFRRYNMSDLYALFVGDLANRIAGRGTFRTAWSELTQVRETELAAIQRHLKERGFAISKIDGKLGSNTRSQIGQYQRSVGQRPNCWPTRALLARLRSP